MFCNTGGIGELKKHDLFVNVDWEGLSESTPPKLGPFRPTSESEVCDTLNANII